MLGALCESPAERCGLGPRAAGDAQEGSGARARQDEEQRPQGQGEAEARSDHEKRGGGVLGLVVSEQKLIDAARLYPARGTRLA